MGAKSVKRVIELHNAVVVPSVRYAGTLRCPKPRKDRWGCLRAGEARTLGLYLHDASSAFIGAMDVPRAWYGASHKINVRVVAEITEVRRASRKRAAVRSAGAGN